MSNITLRVIVVITIITGPIFAQQSTTRFFTDYAIETITIDNTSGGVGFTSSNYSPTNPWRAERVMFKVECASGTSCPMRFTTNGTTVTSSVGMLVDYGDVITIYGFTNIKNFRGIRTGSVSASIQPTYSY